ncbi:MAG: DUF4186 domain-containing protein [Pigmentiphaga sp.]|uniref:DUF4186 domain-containing protein n=1 Tax=Pigmentiphaga sp. TaxID=1977564 RepID=UPI0029BE65C0|nr:DUF4186 domain-containing protein [Pigmentiphaga sp.]MDX3905796.1 DUF4186 domain-containing protein [Pigmentiphaga sp.]
MAEQEERRTGAAPSKRDERVAARPAMPASPDALFERLARSAFRRRFRLNARDQQYLRSRGLDAVLAHAAEFVARRLAPAVPHNDGKQTPMRGHPVFVAQHATATCCRGCLAKWHGIEVGRGLSSAEQAYVVGVIGQWLRRQERTRDGGQAPRQGRLF